MSLRFPGFREALDRDLVAVRLERAALVVEHGDGAYGGVPACVFGGHAAPFSGGGLPVSGYDPGPSAQVGHMRPRRSVGSGRVLGRWLPPLRPRGHGRVCTYVAVGVPVALMALPLDGYVRVSKVGGREGEGFISPDVQERAIRDWAARNDVVVVMQPHELDVSGGTMDRPVFNRIMQRIRRGESGGVVVYKTDRFARSVQGALNTLAEIGEHGARFASATEPALEYVSPGGRAFLQNMFVSRPARQPEPVASPRGGV